MDPITDFKIINIARKVVSSKWLYVILAVLAIAGGTYLYLNHSTKQQVAAAVKNVNADATLQTYATKDAANSRLVPLQQKSAEVAAQTQKDYEHVRRNIYTAPQADREAPAPRLIVDTLNDLERLSRTRDPDSVPVADVHPSRTRLPISTFGSASAANK